MLPITSFFAGLLGLYFVLLAIDVIRLRRANQVALGDGGFSDLERAIRAHGNFAENVPLGLILLGLFEAYSAQPVYVAVLAGLLTLGRIFHARGLRHAKLNFRVLGMLLTFGALIALSIIDIGFALQTWLAR